MSPPCVSRSPHRHVSDVRWATRLGMRQTVIRRRAILEINLASIFPYLSARGVDETSLPQAEPRDSHACRLSCGGRRGSERPVSGRVILLSAPAIRRTQAFQFSSRSLTHGRDVVFHAANALAVPNHIIAPEDSEVWLYSLFVQVRGRRLIPFTDRQRTRPFLSKPALVPPTPVDARSRIV